MVGDCWVSVKERLKAEIVDCLQKAVEIVDCLQKIVGIVDSLQRTVGMVDCWVKIKVKWKLYS